MRIYRVPSDPEMDLVACQTCEELDAPIYQWSSGRTLQNRSQVGRGQMVRLGYRFNQPGHGKNN